MKIGGVVLLVHNFSKAGILCHKENLWRSEKLQLHMGWPYNHQAGYYFRGTMVWHLYLVSFCTFSCLFDNRPVRIITGSPVFSLHIYQYVICSCWFKFCTSLSLDGVSKKIGSSISWGGDYMILNFQLLIIHLLSKNNVMIHQMNVFSESLEATRCVICRPKILYFITYNYCFEIVQHLHTVRCCTLLVEN